MKSFGIVDATLALVLLPALVFTLNNELRPQPPSYPLPREGRWHVKKRKKRKDKRRPK